MNSKLRLTILALAAAFACGPVFADKPDHAGGGKHGKPDKEQREKGEKGDKNDKGERGSKGKRNDDAREGAEFRFDVGMRNTIAGYYGGQARAGRCPPGLAKKNNGCLPPGQAKKWARGMPLPAGLQYHDLPRDLLMRLPPPPPNHRYVQVAGDVLLIAVGSMMVIDAVEDLFR